VHAPSSERPLPPKFLRARAAASIESVAYAAAVASVTPDRAISGARAEQRAACAAHASERESRSSIDRERSRRSRGGERHTRLGDQRCTRRAASGLCRSSLRGRARAATIESVADAEQRRRASHPTGRSVVHAPSSERPVPLKLLRESKSSFDRERSRRSRGGERHTREGDQRSARRAASGLCCSSFRVRASAEPRSRGTKQSATSSVVLKVRRRKAQ
jgi:hypothetical protein